MKIKASDKETIYGYLIRKRSEGDEFVAFPDDSFPVNQGDLFTFSTQEEALKFCHELSTDLEPYNYLAIRSAYRAMSEAAKDNTLMIERNGLVDVSQMVAVRYQRLEARKSINNQLQNNQKTKIMIQKNFEFLRDQVKYTGFGEMLETALKAKMEKQQPEFTLTHQTNFGKDSTSSVLHFKKSKQSDMYFFNSYKMNLKTENKPEGMEQTFYINKGNNITHKEAYNLMSGRSVNKDLTNKEGQLYNAWVKMDFQQTTPNGNYKLKQYHQNYGYDLEKALSAHPIKELKNEDYKKNLFASLKKGNIQSVTFIGEGKEQQYFVEANPRFKTINVYDNNMQPLNNRQSQKEQQSEGQTVKKESRKEKQAVEDEEPKMPKKAKKKRKKRGLSV